MELLLLVRVGRGGGGIAAAAAVGRDLEGGSGLERAVVRDEDAVGAMARVERWRVMGLAAGASLFSCGGAAALLGLVMAGFDAGAGEGFFADVADRVDRTVVWLEV